MQDRAKLCKFLILIKYFGSNVSYKIPKQCFEVEWWGI